jgi:molybdate transport system substrate-binding protein
VATARAAILACVAAIGVVTTAARAEPVRVLAAGAAQEAIRQLAPAFTASTGHTLDAIFDTVGALRDRVLAGEPAHVIILSEAGMVALQKAGKLHADVRVDLGTIFVALAVRKGASVPDVASPEALARTLLAAKSIAHADPARGATAGAHFAEVMARLGIAEAVRARVTVLGFGGDVVAGVATGRFEIGVSQSSEIIAHPGVTLAGALPAPFAHRTRYVAAKGMGAGGDADALLQLLRSPQGRAVFVSLGFEAP